MFFFEQSQEKEPAGAIFLFRGEGGAGITVLPPCDKATFLREEREGETCGKTWLA